MRAATGTTLPWIFGLPGILLLDARGIGQHELAQVHRAGCAEDASSVALCDEPRQVADVIEVRVGQNDRVERGWGDREVLPVAKPQLLQPLEQPAIEEDARAVVFEEVFRAGHRLCGAEKGQLSHELRRYHHGQARGQPS